MLCEVHPSDDLLYHELRSISGNRVRPSSRKVPVARPSRQVVEVLPWCGLVYLELNKRSSVRGKDDVVETRSMWPNLFRRNGPPGTPIPNKMKTREGIYNPTRISATINGLRKNGKINRYKRNTYIIYCNIHTHRTAYMWRQATAKAHALTW